MPNFEQYNVQIFRLTLDSTTSGDTTIVTSSSTTAKIRIVQCWMMAGAATNVKFGAVTANTYGGTYYLATNGGFVQPWAERGWYTTPAGDSLKINLSGAGPVGGSLHYILIQ